MSKRKAVLITIFAVFAAVGFGSQAESFEFGKKMYRDGFNQEAMIVFERIVNTAPSSSEAEESLFILGEIHLRDENYNEAEKYFRRLVESFPSGRYRERATFYTAESQYKARKYIQSIDTLTRFVELFPASNLRPEAIYYLMDSFFQEGSYDRVTTIGRGFQNDYAGNQLIPDVMLLNAKAYLQTNRVNDAENTLDLIIRNHPETNARWQSVIIRNDLIRSGQGVKAAVDHLVAQLKLNVPRQYEELLRIKLAEMYISQQDFTKAGIQLEELIKKFDRSDRLAEYLHHFAISQADKKNYQSIVDLFLNYQDQIIDTDYYHEFLLNVAEAYYKLNLIEMTEETLNLIDMEQTVEHIRSTAIYWRARIKEHNGLFVDAIDEYQQLLARQKRVFGDDDLLMRIGDIFFDKLQMYQTAINFYNQLVTTARASGEMYGKALYKIALCYEIIGKYEDALETLKQIDTENIVEDAERTIIVNRIELLSRFKVVNHERVTTQLISSFYSYLQNSEQERLKSNLLDIMLYEMYDVDTVLLMLENETSPSAIYMKGKAYLSLAYQAKLENRETEITRYLSLIEQAVNQIGKQLFPHLSNELDLERRYIINNYNLDTQMVQEIETFLSRHPNSSAHNRFNYLLGIHYLNEGILVKADQYVSKVTKDHNIPVNDYENAVKQLAEYYFANEQYEKTITYYELIREKVTLQRPQMLYSYAESLIRSGRRSEGIDRLHLLVHNVSDFRDFASAVDTLADHYWQNNNFDSVVSVMKLLSEDKRDKDFYIRLSNTYLELEDIENAKVSLMKIVDKDNQVLRKLANLHYRTGDLTMAELTYRDLAGKDEDRAERLQAIEMVAHILFLQDKWRESISEYEKILSELGDRINAGQYEFLNLPRIGKEAVISLYRTNNRPRAETIEKRFRSIFDKDPQIIAEIELNEGIYQMSINRGRAEKSFSDIIKNQSYSQKLRHEAFFWRGVNHLENKKITEAQNDFRQVLNSGDVNLRNQANLKLGTISFSQEQFQQSLDHYYSVIQNDTGGELAFDAAKNFAIVSKTIEEWQRAIQAYEIILDRWGEAGLEAETIFNIAYCQFRDRNYPEAIEMFERALVLLDDRELRAESQYWIGESYFNLGQFDRAATEYLKIGYYYPDLVQWNALSELKLAESYIRQNRFESARSILERVITKYGRNSDWGKQALIVLEQI